MFLFLLSLVAGGSVGAQPNYLINALADFHFFGVQRSGLNSRASRKNRARKRAIETNLNVESLGTPMATESNY
jgi:hypothetical protein